MPPAMRVENEVPCAVRVDAGVNSQDTKYMKYKEKARDLAAAKMLGPGVVRGDVLRQSPR